MSFLMRQVAHCDVCGHEWIVVADKVPSHCAKCKSRKWNQPSSVQAAILEDNTKRVLLSGPPAHKSPRHAATCKVLNVQTAQMR